MSTSDELDADGTLVTPKGFKYKFKECVLRTVYFFRMLPRIIWRLFRFGWQLFCFTWFFRSGLYVHVSVEDEEDSIFYLNSRFCYVYGDEKAGVFSQAETASKKEVRDSQINILKAILLEDEMNKKVKFMTQPMTHKHFVAKHFTELL